MDCSTKLVDFDLSSFSPTQLKKHFPDRICMFQLCFVLFFFKILWIKRGGVSEDDNKKKENM